MKRYVYLIAFILTCGMFCFCHDDVYAEYYIGTGGGGTGIPKTCATFAYNFTEYCPESYKDGGASWFIAKTDWNGTYNPSFCAYNENWLNNNSCTTLLSLQDTDRSNVLGGLHNNCSKAKGYDYYAYYAFVGRREGYWRDKNTPYNWGPFGWGYTVDGYSVKYNTRNTKSFDQVKNAWENGTNLDGWQLSSAAAATIYQKMTGKSSIGHGTGYFCVKKDTVAPQDRTLTAYAATTSGQDLENGDKIASHTVTHGNSASVSKKDISGFTFVGWRTSKASGNLTTGNAYTVSSLTANTTIYAIYKPFSATSSLDMKVKNERMETDYQETVYAKPGDNVVFKATYTPSAQGGYSIKPQNIKINGGNVQENSNASKTVGTLFNELKGSGLANWNNAFAVQSKNFDAKYENNHIYSLGSSESHTEENAHTVLASEVGKTLEESAKTNSNDDAKTTPKSVTMSSYNKQSLATVNTGQFSATASVVVPYNYSNTATMIEDDLELFSGESNTIRYELSVDVRQNNTLNATYATIVRNAQWKLQTQTNDGEWEDYTTGSGTLNSSGLLDGYKATKSSSVVIPDVRAGTKICFRSAIYPATNGSDLNIDPAGDGEWAYSKPKCGIVAKKPSLQVWGGNIYTNGKIVASMATKKKLAGYDDAETNYNYVFGSWGELGVFANGTVSFFASGATWGYTSNANGELIANPGGGNQATRCIYSPLTFANYNCTSSVGSFGNNVTMESAEASKKEIIARMTGDSSVDITKMEGDVTLDGREVSGGITYISTNGKLTIAGDLKYVGEYRSLDEMPKIVVYAKSIVIECSVSRIDALLIADETVTTCNSDDINAEKNSKRLQVNGAIIAKTLDANRTYGAATGNNSIIPAEIINFDPTLYLWGGNSKAEESQGSGQLTTTFLTELAPRY